jgi:hypothetical protein
MIAVLQVMKALTTLFRAMGAAANGLANLIATASVAVWMYATEADIQAFKKWLWGTPQERQQMLKESPPLSPEDLALLAEFNRLMDTQHEVRALSKYVLTLPALPDEGY